MMKKFLLMASFLLASVSGFAQLEEGSWTFTPRVGVNFAAMSNWEDSEYRTGFTVGADFERALKSNVSISFGANYSQQGVTERASGVDCTFKMDYINIPVVLNSYLSSKFGVFVGLQPGILVNDEVKLSSGGQSVTVGGVKDALKGEGIDMSSFALSIPVGISYSFGKVKADLRYVYELTNTLTMGDEHSRNSYFQLALGYNIGM